MAIRAKRSAARLASGCGVLRRRFRAAGGLRILCYHGVCSDEAIGELWAPGHFVSASEFVEQMRVISSRCSIVRLPDALEQMSAGGRAQEAAVAVTFDDVAACSLVHARSVLEQYGIRASFFVATGHATSGDLFLGDLLKLVHSHPTLLEPEERSPIAELLDDPTLHKRLDPAPFRPALARIQEIVRQRLAPEILETLRPMNWPEIGRLADQGHAIGGHTVDHVILARLEPNDRRRQIVDCLSELKRRLRREPEGFAFPNGGPGDFGAFDIGVLRELGVQSAATTEPGFARAGDLLRLPRICIGRGHTAESFELELSGFLDPRRRRQQGWR